MTAGNATLAEIYEEDILNLHAVIDQTGLWEAVLRLLRTAVQVKRVTLYLGHLGLGEARVVFTDPPIEETEAWYRERGKLNPFGGYIDTHVGERYYRFRDILGSVEGFRKTEFYKRFAQPEGWDKGMSVMFWNGEEMRAMFSLYRSPRQKEFTEEEIGRILKLSRHIEIAIARIQKINREEAFRSALQSFTRKIPAPLILLDWSLKPIFANLAAYDSAAAWNLGKERAAPVNSRDYFRVPAQIKTAAGSLREYFLRTGEGDFGRTLPDPVIVEHPQQPELRARISAVPHAQASLARPGFVVMFEDSQLLKESADGVDKAERRARALQMLTPAERKVVERVCLGERNEAIAKVLGKSVLTVKTQLNSIYSKLGVESRAQLISRLG